MSARHNWKVKSCQSITSRLGMCKHCYSKYQYREVGRLVNLYSIKEVIRWWSKNGLQLESAC